MFVHHVLARAGDFAADYNAALEDYRRRHKIRTPGRPMPNLRCEPDMCEVPFWLDDLPTGSRSRADVGARAGRGRRGRWSLPSPRPDRARSRSAFDPAADGWEAAGRPARLAAAQQPAALAAALTLTSVLRLLAADQFVHGIGGGQYDQVADALIARHFGLDAAAVLGHDRHALLPRRRRPAARLRALRRAGRPPPPPRRAGRAEDATGRRPSPPPRGVRPSGLLLFHDMHHQLAAAAAGPSLRGWEQKLLETRTP